MSEQKNEKNGKLDPNKVLADVIDKAIAENRLKKWMWFTVSILALSFLIVKSMQTNQVSVKDFSPHYSMVSIEGEIGPGGKNDAHKKVAQIEEAFEEQNSMAVILKLNSGGGSPAHAKIVYDKLTQLKAKYNKPVYATVEDMCASACYYIATAADKIYVSPMSVVGSIGVKMESWDATGLMDKLGVRNDTLKSGNMKVMMSPFQDKDPEVVEYLENEVLKALHATFIEDVKKGRPALANVSNDDDVFSGLVYAGGKSIEVGLADEFGDIYKIHTEAVEEYPGLQIKDLDPPSGILSQLLFQSATELSESSLDLLLK